MRSTTRLTLFALFCLISSACSDRGDGKYDRPIPGDSIQKEVALPIVDHKDTIGANHLYQIYRDNEIAADNKYKNKAIELFGSIASINKDIAGDGFIMFRTNDYSNSVQCSVADMEALAKIHRGDWVSMSAICRGMTLGNVVLNNGVINTIHPQKK